MENCAQNVNPLVSVILTSWNRPRGVQRSIQSILSQTYTNFELLIMDDNSNKETIRSIKKFLFDDRVRLYEHDTSQKQRRKQTRYAVMINEALNNYVNGGIICYAVCDDYYLPDRLYNIVECFNNKKVNLLYNYTQIVEDRKRKNILGFFSQDKIGRWNAIDHSSIGHKRSLLDIIPHEDGKYWEENKCAYNCSDWYFLKKAAKVTEFKCCPKVLNVKTFHDKTITNLYSHDKLWELEENEDRE